jgi:tetratricopeptide (TPR) repeat protein
MEKASIEQLLESLKNPDRDIRFKATEMLWQRWFEQKGAIGLELLRRAVLSLNTGDFATSEALLTDIIETQPDFAEAWNRRAVLYYIQKKFNLSKSDCERVIQLVPYHFGAWHGLGLCNAALGNYLEAIKAFRRAISIQPYSLENQKLILECTARLN